MSPAMNGAKLVKGFVNMVMGMQAYQEWNNSECSWGKYGAKCSQNYLNLIKKDRMIVGIFTSDCSLNYHWGN